jgi:hypothetical protein
VLLPVLIYAFTWVIIIIKFWSLLGCTALSSSALLNREIFNQPSSAVVFPDSGLSFFLSGHFLFHHYYIFYVFYGDFYCFFFRYCHSGFRSRWCLFWHVGMNMMHFVASLKRSEIGCGFWQGILLYILVFFGITI